MNGIKDKMVSFKKLSEEKPKPVKWLIQDILPQCAITALSSPKKCYKTYLAIDMSLCVSEGSDFLGHYPTTQCNILYLDEETGHDEMVRRVHRVCKGNNLTFNKENSFYLCNTGFKIDNSRHMAELKQIIKENNIGLVVLDTFPRFFGSGTDENSAISMMEITGKLKELSNETGVGWLLITHFRKNVKRDYKDSNMELDADAIRGSGEIANVSDNIFLIDRDKKKSQIELKNSDSRISKEVEPITIVLTFDKDSDSTSVTFTPISLEKLGLTIKTNVQKYLDFINEEFDKQLKLLEDKDIYSLTFYWHDLKEMLNEKFTKEKGGKVVNNNEIRQILDILAKENNTEKIAHGQYRYWAKGWNINRWIKEIASSQPIEEEETTEEPKEKIYVEQNDKFKDFKGWMATIEEMKSKGKI